MSAPFETLDLSNYKTSDLKNVADIDCFGVRDAAYARQELVIPKIAAAERLLTRLKSELDEIGLAIEASSKAERKASTPKPYNHFKEAH